LRGEHGDPDQRWTGWPTPQRMSSKGPISHQRRLAVLSGADYALRFTHMSALLYHASADVIMPIRRSQLFKIQVPAGPHSPIERSCLGSAMISRRFQPGQAGSSFKRGEYQNESRFLTDKIDGFVQAAVFDLQHYRLWRAGSSSKPPHDAALDRNFGVIEPHQPVSPFKAGAWCATRDWCLR